LASLLDEVVAKSLLLLIEDKRVSIRVVAAPLTLIFKALIT
jgi:hypothetical protein